MLDAKPSKKIQSAVTGPITGVTECQLGFGLRRQRGSGAVP